MNPSKSLVSPARPARACVDPPSPAIVPDRGAPTVTTGRPVPSAAVDADTADLLATACTKLAEAQRLEQQANHLRDQAATAVYQIVQSRRMSLRKLAAALRYASEHSVRVLLKRVSRANG